MYSIKNQVTASLGEEAHLFLRAKDRRLHYSGQVVLFLCGGIWASIDLTQSRFNVQSTVFTVRNGGHSAGFDEEGALRIF